jgi:hypothetical protein
LPHGLCEGHLCLGAPPQKKYMGLMALRQVVFVVEASALFLAGGCR